MIPARMASTRFPGKPLCDLLGKPMVQWVYEASVASGVAESVLIATPDDEILAAAEAFGAPAIRTRLDHPSGTDRIAEVAEHVAAEVYINVQGDEPLIPVETIRACAAPFGSPEVEMTSVFSLCPEDELENPAVVKVVTDAAGRALYFSRHTIPYPRNPRVIPVKKHIGIYGYRREVLQAFATWSPSPLELTESLEQLRFLENGVQIHMAEGRGSALAVDTPEQAEEVRAILAQRTAG
ncbi:MAG: 3-deoxy-manno-octulosonate cytidylyltransferase [Fimbriimonas sp.]